MTRPLTTAELAWCDDFRAICAGLSSCITLGNDDIVKNAAETAALMAAERDRRFGALEVEDEDPGPVTCRACLKNGFTACTKRYAQGPVSGVWTCSDFVRKL